MSAPAPSPEIIARAVKLRRQGLSYVAIAESCGLTKGVVAGMLFRAGVCVSHPVRTSGSDATRTPARTLKRKRNASPKQAKPEPVRLPVPVLPSRLLPPGLSCAWPLWTDDTPRELRRCCGDPTGRPGMSYCLAHWRIGYLPQREMRA